MKFYWCMVASGDWEETEHILLKMIVNNGKIQAKNSENQRDYERSYSLPLQKRMPVPWGQHAYWQKMTSEYAQTWACVPWQFLWPCLCPSHRGQWGAAKIYLVHLSIKHMYLVITFHYNFYPEQWHFEAQQFLAVLIRCGGSEMKNKSLLSAA